MINNSTLISPKHNTVQSNTPNYRHKPITKKGVQVDKNQVRFGANFLGKLMDKCIDSLNDFTLRNSDFFSRETKMISDELDTEDLNMLGGHKNIPKRVIPAVFKHLQSLQSSNNIMSLINKTPANHGYKIDEKYLPNGKKSLNHSNLIFDLSVRKQIIQSIKDAESYDDLMNNKIPKIKPLDEKA